MVPLSSNLNLTLKLKAALDFCGLKMPSHMQKIDNSNVKKVEESCLQTVILTDNTCFRGPFILHSSDLLYNYCFKIRPSYLKEMALNIYGIIKLL